MVHAKDSNSATTGQWSLIGQPPATVDPRDEQLDGLSAGVDVERERVLVSFRAAHLYLVDSDQHRGVDLVPDASSTSWRVIAPRQRDNPSYPRDSRRRIPVPRHQCNGRQRPSAVRLVAPFQA